MRDHHSYPMVSLGGSDIASLILRAPGKLSDLFMGEDGEYSAYVVDEECLIPSRYTQAFECESWLRVYDDENMVKKFRGDVIRVFRCGAFGIIIQIFGRNEELKQ